MERRHEVPRRGRGPWARTLSLSLGLLLGSTTVLLAAPAAQATDPSTLLGQTPYVPLFTQVNDCAQVRAVNQLTGSALEARLDELARTYVHFHSEASNVFLLGRNCQGSSPTTLAAKLAAKGAWVSNYRNGSFVSQASPGQVNFGEAADLETRAPLAIGTYWPGNARPNVPGDDASPAARLTQALSEAAQVVRISQVPAADRPAGTPATWPFLNSRGRGAAPGAHSLNTHDFVSWIRVDDELMQVVAEPALDGGDVVLTVRRGLWGTRPAPHAAGTRVMAPTYIGNRNGDPSLAGTPARDDPNVPLRYAIKIWTPEGWGWIADRIQATFGPDLQGYNTVWLDVSSCFQDNHADPFGNPVFGWYDDADTKMTTAAYGAAQKTKLAGLRARFPGVRFTGNNLYQNDPCSNDLLGGAYDGGVLENYARPTNGPWSSQMDQTFKVMASNWPAIFWVRWDSASVGDPAAYRRFAYGSVLLAYRATATRYQLGGPWDLSRPHELFFWDWGSPQGNPTRLADLAVPGTPLYRRDFQNGIVVVNPSASRVAYDLGRTFYDVVNKDALGRPRAVTRITVGPADAAFLLRQRGV